MHILNNTPKGCKITMHQNHSNLRERFMSHIKFLRDPDLTRTGVLKNLCGVFMLFILFVTSIILIIGIKHDYFIATNGVQDFAYITNKRSYETQSGKFSISRTNYEIHYTFLDDSQNEINKQTHVDQDFYTQHNIGDKFKIIRIDN
ncbi:MAG: hypothetical protein Q8K36_05990, partial [Alphaproteobacteria bacterium]|nr:hypothetical protein [Alphaproteobacteria bacterium]